MKLVPQNIQEIAAHYSRATGVPCSILDIRKETLSPEHCSFCTTEPSSKNIPPECISTHLHSAQLSERFGGSYTYFCNHSLLHWVSPVYSKGKMEYAIIAGPVLVIEEAEIAQEQNQETTEEGGMSNIQHLDISRVHDMSEILRMCAGWASGFKEHVMEENRTLMKIQSHAYDFIHDLKEEDESQKERTRTYIFEKENILQDAIRWGDRQTSQKVMNDILGAILLTDATTIELTKFRILELFVLISRAAQQGGVPDKEIMAMSYRFQREIGFLNSFEGMALWLSKTLRQFSDLVFASREMEYGAVFAQAVRYIRLHYREHITLEETAQAVLLSPTYFSRLFKEKMNISFTSYVNTLRIEEAQRLLLDTRSSIIEIAEAVGFEDQSYFSKVFKEISQRTPSQYRKYAGYFPSDTHEIHT